MTREEEIAMPEGTIKGFTVSTGPLPASRKIRVAGHRHAGLSVAMREIDLSPAAISRGRGAETL